MQTPSSRTVWFDRESESFFAGLPIGNGRTGAMVTGGLPTQTLHLNDETFWSPGPRERDFGGARASMETVRQLLAAGDVLGAQAAARPLLGDPILGAALQPVGDISLATDIDFTGADFFRSLGLATGVVTFEWTWADGRSLRREFIAARTPSAFVVRQTSTIPGTTHLSFSSPFGSETSSADDATLVASGRWQEVSPNRQLVADSYRLRDYNDGVRLRFAVGATMLSGEGNVSDGILSLTSTDWTVAIALNTDFAEVDPGEWVREVLAGTRRPVDELVAAAIAAHSEVFERAAISLEGAGNLATASTDRRVHAVRAGGVDDELVLLVADYGRYLQIASTLGGTLPPTLQGIWNADTEPAWCSNFTVNINLQMNLWSADTFRFPEGVAILGDFVERLAVAGQHTAEVLYGASGWVVHHNTDLWLNTAPTTLVEVGLFAGGGLWLIQQLVRHYETYPELVDADSLFTLLTGAIDFFETWLVEDADGYLATSPSSSPENAYLLGDTSRPRSRAEDPEYWRHGWIGQASTIEMLLVRDTLRSVITLGANSGASRSQLEGWKATLDRLRPVQLQDGEFPEWTRPYRALELGHRHLSPLYGLYPGTDDFSAEPTLHEAARTTLANRQANVTSSSNGWGGWSKVWAAACWARLGDGDRALASIHSLLMTGISPDSLLHAFPDFDGEPAADAVHQSDANLGLPAAVSELVLRSTPGHIRLLPALPSRWSAGSVRTLRAAGGVDVSFAWAAGCVTSAEVTASRDQTITLHAQGHPPQTITLTAGLKVSVNFAGEEPNTQEEAHK
jgi:alpha-L-fucosidase 2